MKRNFKVITINGIRGIFAVIFLVMGLIAGFVISPSWLCMTLWNHFVAASGSVAQMSLWQGLMMWAIIALSLYALNNKFLHQFQDNSKRKNAMQNHLQ